MTIEEQLAAAKADNEKLAASIAKLDAKNKEIIEEKRKATAEADAARDAAEAAATEAAAKTGDVDAIKTAHAKELKKLQDQLRTEVETRDARLSELLIDNGIKTGLAEHNVAPQYHEAVTALIRMQTKLDGGEAKFGDVSLADGMKTFLTGEKGKHFVAAAANSGANAPGSKATAARMTKETFNMTEFLKMAAQDSAGADALADEMGMPHLKG